MIAIMARDTIARDTRMIEIPGSEVNIRSMANITILTRWYMVSRFPVEISRGRAELTTMTTFTTTGNERMFNIKECR